jgi:hypothetical protein
LLRSKAYNPASVTVTPRSSPRMDEKDDNKPRRGSVSSFELPAFPHEEKRYPHEEGTEDIGSASVAPVPGVIPEPADADEALGDIIDRLPTQFREEILKQYDLPQEKYSLFTIFKWATPFEVFLQVFGLLMAIGAGIYRPLPPPLTLAAVPHPHDRLPTFLGESRIVGTVGSIS